MYTNTSVHYGLKVVLVCLHITLSDSHYYADVSIYLEQNVFRVYSGECVSKIKSILSKIFFEIYGAVRFYLNHFWGCLWEYVYFIL